MNSIITFLASGPQSIIANEAHDCALGSRDGYNYNIYVCNASAHAQTCWRSSWYERFARHLRIRISSYTFHPLGYTPYPPSSLYFPFFGGQDQTLPSTRLPGCMYSSLSTNEGDFVHPQGNLAGQTLSGLASETIPKEHALAVKSGLWHGNRTYGVYTQLLPPQNLRSKFKLWSRILKNNYRNTSAHSIV